MDNKKKQEIPFGAFDSEIMHQEITIPEGFEAEIKGDKIILTKTDSEDERIRNAVEAILNDTEPHIYNGLGVLKTDILTWFEKQGKPIDKVEPKFHEGEWVVFNNRHDSVYQVEKIENYEYTLRHFLGGSMPLSFSHGDMIRAWTVKDAKHGDVLWCETGWTCIFKTLNSDNISFSSYCFMDYTGCGWFCETGSESHKAFIKAYNGNIHPATKKQRDLFFQKMHEAGYKWDAEKKKLKKIEDEEYNGEDYGIDGLWHAMNILEKTLGKVSGYQSDDGILEHKCAITAVKKLYGQKSIEWSEEDSVRLQRIIDFLWYNRKGDTDAIYQQEQDIDWLKSLKPQNTWKPTGLQLECLSDAIERYNSEGYPADVLKTLLRQLKKIG